MRSHRKDAHVQAQFHDPSIDRVSLGKRPACAKFADSDRWSPDDIYIRT